MREDMHEAQIVSLNGNDWEYKDFLGEDWVWRNAEKPDTRDTRFWRKGTVPGSVHDDLWKNGEIPDPYFERNSMLCEWVPARTWIYRKTFAPDPSWQGKRIRLHFKGIDYEAEIFLNGQSLGKHKGMYTSAGFDVTQALQYETENLLALVIEPAPPEQPQVSKTSRVTTHKSRMTYWWDFCPRMIHVGIWDDVYLEITGPAALEDVFVRPQLNADFSRADVAVSMKISSIVQTLLAVETILLFEGEEVARTVSRHAAAPGITAIDEYLEVNNPRLWWPNGYGEQPQYDVKVAVYALSEDGSESVLSSAKTLQVGIRRVELAANETADSTALPYTFEVNGRKIYIKGWNWVPMDVMYGVERPEKLLRLLTLAKRANVNMLRVWGGGLIEKDAFYEICSRFGIMVWQEFIQSSSGIENKPSEDPDFIAMMVREAEQIIPRKRNHASLVLWCGGNELQAGEDKPLDDREPVLGALHEAVRRLDPDRHWLPTSPSGRTFSNSLKEIAKDPLALHDVHGPWEHQGLTAQYTLFNQGTSLLHSEFGVEGMTHLKTLRHTIAPEHEWPATKDNPVYFHRGSWWINEPLIQRAFGGGIHDIDIMIKASQLLQYEGLRYAVESNRRRKYQNSGTLPWQFNEPFPNAYCTSALDYYTNPKPVYYGVAQAYEPLHVSAAFSTQAWAGQDRFAADIWVSYSGFSDREAQLDARLVGADGSVYAQSSQLVGFKANRATNTADITCPLAQIACEIFYLDLQLTDTSGHTIASNRYAFSRTDTLQPLLDQPEAVLQADVSEEGEQWYVTVHNKGNHAALYVQLEDHRSIGANGYVYFSDNYFSMLPGESKKIVVDFSRIPAEQRRLEISGWNTPKTVLSAE